MLSTCETYSETAKHQTSPSVRDEYFLQYLLVDDGSREIISRILNRKSRAEVDNNRFAKHRRNSSQLFHNWSHLYPVRAEVN